MKNKIDHQVSRRTFLRGAAGLTILTAAGSARSYAANDRVRIGIVGCGGMGSRHIEALCVNPRVELAAVCDVYVPRHQKARRTVEEMTGKRPSEYQDYRKFLEQDDIEAFWIASPDNWHPLLTIHGCQAGKDVYVEKPACPTVVEGRAMVNAARRHGRIVQLGTQQRSMPLFQQAIGIVHSGKLGEITAAGAWVDTNGWSVGEQPGPVPEGLDWNMWLGPAPWAPFSPQRFAGWMGWHDYARGGQLTNWGVHLMDIVHWGIKQDRPLSVQSIGGNYRQGAGSENYESIESIYEYPGCNVKWTQRHSFKPAGKSYGIHFYGTEGSLFVDRGTCVVRPTDGEEYTIVGEPEKSWANKDHHNNFLDCVRDRTRPAAEIEQGVRSTISVLLAGIALKARRKLNWDGDAERFIDDPMADRYLARAYRAPWHL